MGFACRAGTALSTSVRAALSVEVASVIPNVFRSFVAVAMSRFLSWLQCDSYQNAQGERRREQCFPDCDPDKI
jgi:hypothetical protein